MIGIHSPEFEFEKDRGRVERFARKFKLDHPICIDNDYVYWNALHNEYWPEFYMVDRRGMIRGKVIGEMHEDTVRATQFEWALNKLLKEEYSATTE